MNAKTTKVEVIWTPISEIVAFRNTLTLKEKNNDLFPITISYVTAKKLLRYINDLEKKLK